MHHSYHSLYHGFICRRTLETVECYSSTPAVEHLNCISFRLFSRHSPQFVIPPEKKGGRRSVVGITTLCGLDCPGLETLRGQVFLDPYRRVLRPTQSPVQPIRGVYPEGKSTGTWPWPSTLTRPGSSIDRVKPLSPLYACLAYNGTAFASYLTFTRNWKCWGGRRASESWGKTRFFAEIGHVFIVMHWVC
jgi:hypothetical protein